MTLPLPSAAPTLAPAPPLAGPIDAWIVGNPAAGRGAQRDGVAAAAAAWSARGWRVSVHWTRAAGDAERVSRAAVAAGAGVVAAAGGDGTVHEVANGLVGTPAALAVLPAGTANVLAAQLGLVGWPSPWRRADLAAAAAALAGGRVRAIDVGLARPTGAPPRAFVLWAGVGLDADVVHRLAGPARALKARHGPLAFAAVGWRALRAARGCDAIVRGDGARRRVRLYGAVVCNIPLYAGLFRLAPEARLDDGRLDLALFAGPSRHGALATWLRAGAVTGPRSFARRVVQGRPDPTRALATAVRSLRIVARPSAAVHLDGEPAGTTPLDVAVGPHALRLVVPAAAPPWLWDGGPAPVSTPAADASARGPSAGRFGGRSR